MSTKEQHKPGYITAAEMRSKGRAVKPKDAATLIIVRARQQETPNPNG